MIKFIVAYCASFLIPRQKETDTFKRILIIHTGKLGDTVCATPMFNAIRNSELGYECVVSSSNINGEILAHNTYIDSFVLWPKRIMTRIQLLYSQNPSVICITTPNFDSLVAAILSRAQTIIAPNVVGGYSPYMTMTYKMLLTRVTSVPFLMNEYVPQQYLNLLNPIGIYSQDTTKYLYHSEQAQTLAEQKIQTSLKGRAIGIAIGAGNEIKQWSIEKFHELVKVLIKQYPNDIFYIIGGKQEAVLVEKFFSMLLPGEIGRVVRLTDLSIDELKACISKLGIFIGVDTGPIYIAEAYKIPLVDIIGPVSEKEQPPQVSFARLVYLKDREKPEIHIMNSRVYNVTEARRQIEDISVDMVLQAVQDLPSKT